MHRGRGGQELLLLRAARCGERCGKEVNPSAFSPDFPLQIESVRRRGGKGEPSWPRKEAGSEMGHQRRPPRPSLKPLISQRGRIIVSNGGHKQAAGEKPKRKHDGIDLNGPKLLN